MKLSNSEKKKNHKTSDGHQSKRYLIRDLQIVLITILDVISY